VLMEDILHAGMQEDKSTGSVRYGRFHPRPSQSKT